MISVLLILLAPRAHAGPSCVLRGLAHLGERELGFKGRFALTGSRTRMTVNGTLSEIELVPGYKVLAIADERRTVHLFDPDLITIESRGKVKRETIAPQKRLGTVELDLSRLRSEVCRSASVLRRTPRIRNIESVLQKLDPEIVKRLGYSFMNRCFAAIGAAPLILGTYVYSAQLRNAGTRNPLTVNNSNVTIGLAAMGLMHNCLSRLAPKAHEKILRATVTTNVLANLYFEVDVGLGHRDPLTEIPVSTDPADLSAGVGTAVLYLAATRVLEDHYGLNFAAYCK